MLLRLKSQSVFNKKTAACAILLPFRLFHVFSCSDDQHADKYPRERGKLFILHKNFPFPSNGVF